jgi:hypothetical protein
MSTAVRNTRQTAIKIFGEKPKRSAGATPTEENRPGRNLDGPDGPGRAERRANERLNRRHNAISAMEGRLGFRKPADNESVPSLRTRWGRVNKCRSMYTRSEW